MPSSPSLQAWAKTVGPSPSICSLNRIPDEALATIDASVALRTSSGSVSTARSRRLSPWRDTLRFATSRQTLRVSLAEIKVQVQASVPRPPCRLCRNRVSQLSVGSRKRRDRDVACFHRAGYRHWINILDSVIQDEE